MNFSYPFHHFWRLKILQVCSGIAIYSKTHWQMKITIMLWYPQVFFNASLQWTKCIKYLCLCQISWNNRLLFSIESRNMPKKTIGYSNWLCSFRYCKDVAVSFHPSFKKWMQNARNDRQSAIRPIDGCVSDINVLHLSTKEFKKQNKPCQSH